MAKVEWHLGELFPRVGFVVANLTWRSKRVVQFYNQRGTAEQWIKEGKVALTWTRLSCHDFRDNEVRLQLFVLAYNLGNFLWQFALPRKIQHRSLTTLREKLIKIGAKVVRHSKYVTFQLAEVAVPRKLFAVILEKIDSLRWSPGTGLCRLVVRGPERDRELWAECVQNRPKSCRWIKKGARYGRSHVPKASPGAIWSGIVLASGSQAGHRSAEKQEDRRWRSPNGKSRLTRNRGTELLT